METAYGGRQIVGMDLHRRRSVMVRMTDDGRRLGTARITNSPKELRAQIARDVAVGAARYQFPLSDPGRFQRRWVVVAGLRRCGGAGWADHANGDGRAITLHQADLDLPELKLGELARWSVAAAGEDALARWGWSMDRDPEGVRHWRPRARGVSRIWPPTRWLACS